jgi:hypothetical protein
MDTVKSEINMNDEEYIDVSGEDNDMQHMAPGDPHIMRSTRFRRPRRPVDASPYAGQYSRRIITRNVHQQLGGDLDDNFEEEIVEETEEDSRQLFNNPEIEMEIASDVALVQRTRTKR